MRVDIYSKRKKLRESGELDVFKYDEIPPKLRVQIRQIMLDALGDEREFSFGSGRREVQQNYQVLVRVLRAEYGVVALKSGVENEADLSLYQSELLYFLDKTQHPDKILDLVEVLCTAVLSLHDGEKGLSYVSEINHRFRENGLGYEFVGNIIVRVDSKHLHSEVIKPAFFVLNDLDYAVADEEYRSAFEHYRHSRYQESVIDCAKAFESVMKVICSKRDWVYSQNDTAKKLVEIILKNNLVPAHWQAELSGLRSLLESAVAVPRNKHGAHGGGTQKNDVPECLVKYMLNATAATILFLIESEAMSPI
jgi:hypothetical protein